MISMIHYFASTQSVWKWLQLQFEKTLWPDKKEIILWEAMTFGFLPFGTGIMSLSCPEDHLTVNYRYDNLSNFHP